MRPAQGGVIYVAAVSGGKTPEERPSEAGPATPPRTAPVATVTTEISGVVTVDAGSQTGSEARTAGSAESPGATKGAVYRIQPDGLWDTIWESADDLPYDLPLETNGSVLVGTGPKGKLFRIEGEPPRATLLGRVGAQQVTHLLPAGQGDTLASTANPGTIVRLGPGRAARGTFESEVRDAQTVSSWGTISWKASVAPGSRLELFTRSGNSQTPDDTWSAWSGPYQNADGDQILSPKARFLQWKAVLSGGEVEPRADVRHRRLSAAQPPARRVVNHRYIRRARCSRNRTRPASSRLPATTTLPATRAPSPSPAAPRRASRHPGPGARPPHVPEGAADVPVEGARTATTTTRVRRSLPP